MSMDRRVAKLEAEILRRERPSAVITLPLGYCPADVERALAAERAAGWLGSVVVGFPRMTAAEWTARFCPPAAQ